MFLKITNEGLVDFYVIQFGDFVNKYHFTPSCMDFSKIDINIFGKIVFEKVLSR